MKKTKIEICIPSIGIFTGRDIFVAGNHKPHHSWIYGIDLAKSGLDFVDPQIEEGEKQDLLLQSYDDIEALKAYRWAKRHVQKGRYIFNIWARGLCLKPHMLFFVALSKRHAGKSLQNCYYRLV